MGIWSLVTPKNIKGPEDLGQDDVLQSHPNSLTEGIIKFCGTEMLKGRWVCARR